MAYPHKWSPISYKSSAGQRKHIGQRPMLYRWTTQPTGQSAAGNKGRIAYSTTTATTVSRPFIRDHPGEPVPEENFWTLWCKGRLTEANTPTIRLGATPSGLSSAHVHQPLLFTGRMPFLPPNQQCHSTAPSLHQTKYLIQITDSMAWYNIHSQISTASFCIIS